MKIISKVLFAVTVCVMTLTTACSRDSRSYSVNAPDCAEKVLVSVEASEFKEALARSIAEKFTGRDVYVFVIDQSSLASQDVAEWDGIVVVTKIVAGRIIGSAAKFLSVPENAAKTVVVATCGSETFDLDMPGIDDVSCASIVVKVDEKADIVCTRIDALLARN